MHHSNRQRSFSQGWIAVLFFALGLPGMQAQSNFSGDPFWGDTVNYELSPPARWRVVQDLAGRGLSVPVAPAFTFAANGGEVIPSAIALGRDSLYDDFTLDLLLRAPDQATDPFAEAVLIFGWQDSANYAFLRLSAQPQATTFFRVIQGARCQVGEALSGPFVSDTTFAPVQLVRQANTLRLRLNGTDLLTTSDPLLGEPGQVGFGSLNDRLVFDNVTVVGPAATPRFAPDPFFGLRSSYLERDSTHWRLGADEGDRRYLLPQDLPIFDAPGGGGNILASFAVARDSAYEDFVLSLDVRCPNAETNPNASFGLVFGFIDSLNYRMLRVSASANQTSAFRVENGVRNFVGGPFGQPVIPDSAYHRYKLVRQGQQVTLLIDNDTTYQGNFGALSQVGQVGFGTFNDRLAFDNVTVSGSTQPLQDRFSGDPLLGLRSSYTERLPANWALIEESGNRRYALVNAPPLTSAPGGGGRILGDYAITPSPAYADFDFSLLARTPSATDPNGDIGLVFGFQDDNNYLFLRLSPVANGTNLFQVAQGVRTFVGGSLAPITLPDTAYHHYRLTRRGDSLGLYLDSVLITGIQLPPVAEPGRLGFGSLNDLAAFDEVQLSGTPLLDRFSPAPDFGRLSRYELRPGSAWEVLPEADPLLALTAPGPDAASNNGFPLPGNAAILRDSLYEALNFELEARLPQPADTAGLCLLFDYEDAQNFRFLRLTSGPFGGGIFGVAGGNAVQVGPSLTTGPWSDSAFHRLRLMRDSSHLGLFVDGELVYQWESDSLDGSGRVGIGSLDTRLEADNLRLSRSTSLPGPDRFDSAAVYGLRSSFTETDTSQWNVQVQEGDLRYVLTQPQPAADPLSGQLFPASYTRLADSSYQNFLLQLSAKGPAAFTAAKAGYVLIFGWEDPANFLYLSLTPNGYNSGLFAVENGRTGAILSSLPEGLLPDNAWHRLSLARVGNLITLTLDGNEVLQHAGTDIASPGGLGFGSINTEACFDSVHFARNDQPVRFSPEPFFGLRSSYEELRPIDWALSEDGANIRYSLIQAPTARLANGGGQVPGNFATARDSSYTHFTFTFDARVPEASQNPGADFVVVFDYQDTLNYTFLRLGATPNAAGFFRLQNGVRETLGGFFSAQAIPDDAYHRYGLLRAGSRVEFYRDSSMLFSSTRADWSSGRLGVGTLNDRVFFDNLKIERAVVLGAADPSLGPIALQVSEGPAGWTLRLPERSAEAWKVSLIDLQGRQVAQVVANRGQQQVELGWQGLSAGLYLYRVELPGHAPLGGKLLRR
jgi:hypothetical protein